MIRANERLTDYRILAPWVGIVSQVHVRDGDFVFVRSPLVEIFDPGSLIVRFALPENHAIDIAVGTEIEITLDAYPKRTLSGKINRVYPDIDRQTRTRLAEAKIDQKLALLPGMFARIKVPLTRIADAVVVPKDAVIYSVGVKPALFVLKPNHTVERRTIELGIETDKFAHIRSGIKAGETVVISGYGRLRDGAKVRVSRTSHKKQRDTSHKKQRDTSHKK
jgi:RND family efflux transporter MFP subunit